MNKVMIIKCPNCGDDWACKSTQLDKYGKCFICGQKYRIVHNIAYKTYDFVYDALKRCKGS